ncbi:MAG: hypothetical protein WCD89_02375 [Anaerocolumna sp.]
MHKLLLKSSDSLFSELNAAHAIDGAAEEEKQHDDDIMDDEEFWK